MRFFNYLSFRFIIVTILEFSPKKYREFLIKSFKFLGWTLLILGIIAIFIGYTTTAVSYTHLTLPTICSV